MTEDLFKEYCCRQPGLYHLVFIPVEETNTDAFMFKYGNIMAQLSPDEQRINSNSISQDKSTH
jgi:hypothetical protein